MMPSMTLTRCLLVLFAASVAAASTLGLRCGNTWQTAICRDTPAMIGFSDGCNRIVCSHSVYLTTFKACREPSSDVDQDTCESIKRHMESRVEKMFSITCPLLSMDAVCATAARGFTYSDGCNNVTCDGAGSGHSTRRFCPGPSKPNETAVCDRRLRRLIDLLEPRTCRSINSTTVCLAERIGFRYSDGCNVMECGLNGTSKCTTTLNICEPATVESALCRWYERQARVGASGRSSGASTGSTGGGREFACPALTMRRICTADMVGFRYNDGCNDVHCVSPSYAASTLKLCQPAKPMEAAAQSVHCRAAEAQMEKRRAFSKTHYKCLTAADICRTSEPTVFFDGCNYCFCKGPGWANCSQHACRPYFSTEDEFKAECARRKAGVVN